MTGGQLELLSSLKSVRIAVAEPAAALRCCLVSHTGGTNSSVKVEPRGFAGCARAQELFSEYFEALQRPGIPQATFRIKVFAFRALVFEMDCAMQLAQEGAGR